MEGDGGDVVVPAGNVGVLRSINSVGDGSEDGEILLGGDEAINEGVGEEEGVETGEVTLLDLGNELVGSRALEKVVSTNVSLPNEVTSVLST